MMTILTTTSVIHGRLTTSQWRRAGLKPRTNAEPSFANGYQVFSADQVIPLSKREWLNDWMLGDSSRWIRQGWSEEWLKGRRTWTETIDPAKWPERPRWQFIPKINYHIAGSSPYGVYFGNRTSWVSIDLDLSDYSQAEVHIARARAIYEAVTAAAPGVTITAGIRTAKGRHLPGSLHLTLCFPRPITAAERVQLLTALKKRLERDFPDIGWNVKDGVEFKGINGQACYMPFRGDKLNLLGESVLGEFHRQGDLKALMKTRTNTIVDWLKNGHTTPWTKIEEAIRKLLPDQIPAAPMKTHPARKSRPGKACPSPRPMHPAPQVRCLDAGHGQVFNNGPRKGRWFDQIALIKAGKIAPDCLNAALNDLALWCWSQRMDENEAEDQINAIINSWKDASFSDRLTNGDRAEVNRVVGNTVRAVYGKFTYQSDATKTRRILEDIRSKCKNKVRFDAELARTLLKAFPELEREKRASDLLRFIFNRVLYRGSRGISVKYWRKAIAEVFPECSVRRVDELRKWLVAHRYLVITGEAKIGLSRRYGLGECVSLSNNKTVSITVRIHSPPLCDWTDDLLCLRDHLEAWHNPWKECFCPKLALAA